MNEDIELLGRTEGLLSLAEKQGESIVKLRKNLELISMLLKETATLVKELERRIEKLEATLRELPLYQLEEN